MEFDHFRLELTEGRLWKDNEPIKLRAKIAAVLRLLASRPQQLVTAEELMSEVWGDIVVSPVTLNQTILELRRKLGDHARSPRYIETVPRRGFRFIADWQPVGQDSTPTSEKIRQPPILGTPTDETPSVGRETELRQLTRLFETASDGHRQVVFVTGQAGIGKTHLVQHFLRKQLADPATGPFRSAVGHAVNVLGEREAYALAMAALNELARDEANGLPAILKRVAPNWLRQIPRLADDSVEACIPTEVSPGRMLRELCEAFEELTRERPLVIWFEDVHWADPSCIDVISTLATRTGLARLLLIVTLRPADAAMALHPLTSVMHSLHQKGLCTEINLEPLKESDVARYLSQRYQTDGGAAELASTVHQHCEGIPLFMTALINEFVGGKPNVHGLQTIDAMATIPLLRQRAAETISEYIEGQLAGLDTADVELLEAASVVGMVFSVPAVAAALVKDDLEVEAACQRLADWGQFMKRRGGELWPDGTAAQEYSYQHEVFRQVFYNRIPSGRRQKYHRRVGERVEYGHRTDTHVGAATLANHFELGGEPSRAISYLLEAGNAARRLAAPREAVAFYEHALRIVEEEPPTPDRDLQEASIRVQLNSAQTLAHGYGFDQLKVNLERLLELSCVRENNTQLATILLAMGRTQHARAEHTHSLATFAQALDLELPPEALGLRIFAHGSKAMLSVWTGDLLSAEKEVNCAAELDSTSSKLQSAALVTELHLPFLCAKAYTRWLQGYPEQARTTMDRLDELAAGLTRVRAVALSFSAQLAALCGDLGRAEMLDQRAKRHRAEHDTLPSVAPELAPAGWILFQRGQLDSAVTLLERDLASTHDSKEVLLRSVHLATLAEVHLARKDVTAGCSTLDEALTFVERTDECFYEAELYRLRGEFRVMAGEMEDAHADFEQALDVARQQGALSLELKAAISLARLWKSEGKIGQAHELLSTVYDAFTEGFDTHDLRTAKALLKVLTD